MIVHEKLAELHERGFCILAAQFPPPLVDACRAAFWPMLLRDLQQQEAAPNRGPHRHFVPMPFEPPCYSPQFFFDPTVLAIVRGAMDDRIVADQWGCDIPLRGSEYQQFHADYQRPLFAEAPDLVLPAYMLNVSFPLVEITAANGPMEIAPGTHRMPRSEALQALESARLETVTLPMHVGDVLIRHPWALHRGTPNTTGTPRPLVTIRYVRRWYADHSRDVNTIPRHVWESMHADQRAVLRFPPGDGPR